MPLCPRLTVSWQAGEPQQPRAACRGRCGYGSCEPHEVTVEFVGTRVGHNVAGVKHVGSNIGAVTCTGSASDVHDAVSASGVSGANNNGGVSGVCNNGGV